ncbi:hypothetical protein WA538_005321 [Blastocystis sp. DL]
MLRVLQRGVKEGLLSKPLERVQGIRECGKEGFVCDPSWVASYESVKMCIEKMREEGDLWRLPGHVIADVNEEMCEEKREWSERIQSETGLRGKEWVSVTELIVYLFLLDVGSGKRM